MRDMLAALPQFQEMRDQFSLHLNMAEKCMDLFEQKKLLEVGLVEQVLLSLTLYLTSRIVPLVSTQKARYQRRFLRIWCPCSVIRNYRIFLKSRDI
jgi:Sec1 family